MLTLFLIESIWFIITCFLGEDAMAFFVAFNSLAFCGWILSHFMN